MCLLAPICQEGMHWQQAFEFFKIKRSERVDCKHVHRNIITGKFYGRLRNPSEPQRTRLPQNVCDRQLAFVIVFVRCRLM